MLPERKRVRQRLFTSVFDREEGKSEDIWMILQTIRRVLMPLLLILVGVSAAQKPNSVVEQFQSLQAELRKSHTANDWQSNLASATKLKALLNGTPDSLLEVARADVRVGDLNAALHQLEEFVRMGQSRDLLATSPDFAPLLKNTDFAKIQTGMEGNRSAISLGSTDFPLSDSGLLAEDVDYDPRTKRFFITSVREKKIVAVDTSGAGTDFAKAPDNWPMLAIKVDPSRGVLWATEVAMQGFSFAAESDWGRSAVLCYDLKNGNLLRRVEGPRGTALGDMVLTANGDAIVSDGDEGGVYRVPADGAPMQRVDDGDFISPQTPAMHPDGKHIFVPDYVRGIGVLELATKQVRWLSMAGGFALNGIDGLYFDHGRLIAVQNGTSPERVVAFTLDATLTTIESETIIERATNTLGDPTHGVVIGNDFYYIANSGWDAVDDHGNMKPGAKPSVSRMMRAKLPGGTRS
jgi:sugar lactone lactonase YvrE